MDACVRSETNYCDITGESQWVRSVIDGYHDQAALKKLKIVNCCGFDCIPADMGVMMLADAMKSNGVEPEEIRFIMKDAKGAASGGTLASVFNILESSTNEALVASSNPFFLAPRDAATGQPIEATDKAVVNMNRDTFSFLYDKIEGSWEAPYVMQSIDTRIVNRSNALSGWKYGRNVIYREFTGVSNFVVALLST